MKTNQQQQTKLLSNKVDFRAKHSVRQKRIFWMTERTYNGHKPLYAKQNSSELCKIKILQNRGRI